MSYDGDCCVSTIHPYTLTITYTLLNVLFSGSSANCASSHVPFATPLHCSRHFAIDAKGYAYFCTGSSSDGLGRVWKVATGNANGPSSNGMEEITELVFEEDGCNDGAVSGRQRVRVPSGDRG